MAVKKTLIQGGQVPHPVLPLGDAHESSNYKILDKIIRGMTKLFSIS